ncbi:hypothetical protein [Tsukamurella ocularis]|uniref:hypothetical protein n=1 Tax=Tsukamurella ocularis TaxID=1970234 RepID=UPI002167FCC9|nr:hypothetical protein [Tsukamurella ocularis]MCS3781604.1 hypothetical protein [Tsukamurella ocularis]MCS3787976.1 hypothetical protein [Tsukamurella ocularis]MCS3851271.1 hypothetical protein [Tsukamurella ocularis]
MTETYDEVLADVQSEIISVALEYSGFDVDDVYVYLSTERLWHTDIFYRQDGKIVSRAELRGADTSVDRQRPLMKYVRSQLERLVAAATEFGQPAPTEVRLHFIVPNKRLESAFSYTPRELSDDESEHDLVDLWKSSERDK